MQTSRFQLGLIATLAVGLGFALTSSEAIGYPAGSAVSLGTNPVWSSAGRLESGEGTRELVVVESGKDLVITDVVLTFDCTNCSPQVSLLADDTTVGSFVFRHFRRDGSGWSEPKYGTSSDYISHSFESGLRVEGGKSLTVGLSGDSVNYTLSGYYAQP